MNKAQKKQAKIRAKKKDDFIKRYNAAFGITEWWTFILFDEGNESRNTARMRAAVVKYLLENNSGERIENILSKLGENILDHLQAIINNRSPLSPTRIGIMEKKSSHIYYVSNKEKADIWLKFMDELIKRDW